MSGCPPALVELLNAVVAPDERWLFARRVLGADGEGLRQSAFERAGWTDVLADVPVDRVLGQLRRDHPEALARIDGVEAVLVPAAQRLQRVVPVAPSHLCFVGRTPFVEGLLAHPVFESGGHLHLHGPAHSGRSLVAARVAREAADHIPVVVWIDGRSADGVAGALDLLATELGFPPAPWHHRNAQLTEWFAAQGDWLVVVDDAPDVLPACFSPLRGRLLTVGLEPRPDAHATVRLPPLSPPQRAEVVRRWSRGRLTRADGSETVGALAVLAAANATGTVATLAGAVDALSADGRALDAVLRAFAPAPVPLALLTWPEGVAPPGHVSPGIRPLLRSLRVMRAAATELVRRGMAHWVGNHLNRSEVVGVGVTDARSCGCAAELVVHALHGVDRMPPAWSPHVAGLSDDPRVLPHLRQSIATRAGRLALAASDPHRAVTWFQRALAATTGAHPQSEAVLLNDLGVAWRRCGRLDDAVAVLRDALARDQAADPVDQLAVATTQTNLGHVLREREDFEEARVLYQAAHNTRLTMLGPGHRETAVVAIQLGVVSRALGHVVDARDAWTDALAALSRLRPVDRVLTARVLMHLAQLDADAGAVDAAIRGAERAHGLLVAEHDDIDHPEVVRIRALVGRLDAAQKPVPRTR